MSSTELTATLDFLTDTGHLLAATAPETSAFLLSRRSSLMFENELSQTDVERQHVCSCCGHIMLPGNGSTLEIEHRKVTQKKSRRVHRLKKTLQENPSPSGPAKVITCGHCARLTKINLPTPNPISRRKTKSSQTASPAIAQTPYEAPAKVTANANSKKRAKSRKAGLQALLDQKNAASSSRPGLGLSLADFMKT